MTLIELNGSGTTRAPLLPSLIIECDPSNNNQKTDETCVDELLHRQVRIYKPNKATNQSGKGRTNRWLIDWDTLQGAGRWENDLMGWASTADYMQGTTMAFRSKEDAIAFVSVRFGSRFGFGFRSGSGFRLGSG